MGTTPDEIFAPKGRAIMIMPGTWTLRLSLLAMLSACGSSASPLFDGVGAKDAAVADVVAAPESSVDDPNTFPDRTDVPVDPEQPALPQPDAESNRPDAASTLDALVDAKPPIADAGDAGAEAACNRLCEGKGIGTCVGGECVIRCDAKDGCAQRVECPPSVPCRVVCSGATSCAAGVDCTQASNCDIQCSGTGSCKGLVQCAGAKCAVSCAEQDSCTRGVNCNADSCDLSCNGGNACAGGVACMAATRNCTLTCGGISSCGGSVQGKGTSQIVCSGHGSCPNSVACTGESCSILCTRSLSCGGSICCQAAHCNYMGTDRTCM